MTSVRTPEFSWLIEYFLHPALQQESDRLHRARIFIVTMLFIIAMMIATITVVVLVPFPLASKIAAGSICIFLVTAASLLLYALKRSGRFVLCSMVAVVIDFLCITGGILVSGGGAVSPVSQLLAMPPLLGYFFGGVRWGTYTAVAALLEIIVFAGLAGAGLEFYTANDPDKAGDAQLLIGIVGLVAISAMALIYEYTAAMLKQERDGEQAQVNLLAGTDALTGLANRMSFDVELRTRIRAAGDAPQHTFFTLCYLDLNGFKPINDQFGHEVGDEVLRVISGRLQQVSRDGDHVGRHGGDEFMLILDAVRDAEKLQMIAVRMLHSIAEPIITSAGTLSVSGSFGFAVFPDHATDVDALKYAADTAMYVAKRDGGGWHLHQPAAISAGDAPQQSV